MALGGDFMARLWAADPTVWKADDAHHQEVIAGALGWLTVFEDVRDQVEGLYGFLGEVRAEGYRHAVLLGMGGSSLAPEVMTKVLKDFTGHTAFFGEWEEIDLKRNAMLLLGHGFIDPREGRKDRRVQVNPACEAWGFEGNSLGFEATYEPGPVTMTHVIQDPGGWRLLVTEGEIMDLPPLAINESTLVVRVEKPVRDYLRDLMMHGFAHHAMAAPGRVTAHLESFGRQLGMKICRV